METTMKFYISRTEERRVTKYYEIEAEREEAAWDKFYDGESIEIGFNVGKLSDNDYCDKDEYIGNNPPETDYKGVTP